MSKSAYLTLTVSMIADHTHKSLATASHVHLKMNEFWSTNWNLFNKTKLDLLDILNLLILSVTIQNDE